MDDPFFVAGTAVPDWLSVVDRRVRVTSKSAKQQVEEGDPTVAAVAAGIVQHHYDDAWFHGTAVFVSLNLEFSKGIRQRYPEDTSFRPSFLAHILVEILLDAELISRQPDRLVAYYEVLDAFDAARISKAVNQMATRPAERLEAFIPRFSAERFLYDYAEDGKLLGRLNRVMQRVGMPTLQEDFCEFLPLARGRVKEHADELLAGG
ncbi:MAG: hypothetical protein ACC628_12285 [Pirellulaceae bacterium]